VLLRKVEVRSRKKTDREHLAMSRLEQIRLETQLVGLSKDERIVMLTAETADKVRGIDCQLPDTRSGEETRGLIEKA
jgi:hypothetical protein